MSLICSPKIPINGLVLYVDAANNKSYPRSGNIWYDLSGNDHNITLGSSVTFNTQFSGVLNFAQDSNGYGRNSTMNLSTGDYTVISFVRKNSYGNSGRTITSYNNN